MIDAEQLQVMGEKLKVYDVDQGGWEQEPDGYVANATHVLTHLSKDMVVKHFSSKREVETSIAPDSLQYALRLARWTDQEARTLIPAQTDIETVERQARLGNFRKLPQRQIAFLYATATLGVALHEEGHESLRDRAATRRRSDAAEVGRMLVHGATLQAEKFEFDLAEAFDNRLAALRDRFNIPEPQPAE